MTFRAADAKATELIQLEGVLLDEQNWDEWLALFTEDCEYWMPMWQSEDILNSDPDTQLSHIYYRSRAGLEDRVERIRSGRSPASTPILRTTHMVGSVFELEREGESVTLRAAWTCHAFFPITGKNHVFHGSTRYRLRAASGTFRIARKHIRLQNDYIPTMLDINCV